MTDTVKDLYTQLQALAPQIGVQHSVSSETSHVFRAFAKTHTTIAEAEADTYEGALAALLAKLQGATTTETLAIIEENPLPDAAPVVTATAAIEATHSFGASTTLTSPDPAELQDGSLTQQAAQ